MVALVHSLKAVSILKERGAIPALHPATSLHLAPSLHVDTGSLYAQADPNCIHIAVPLKVSLWHGLPHGTSAYLLRYPALPTSPHKHNGCQ